MSEHRAMLTGAARYIADLPFDGLHAVFVRSDVAHGTITSIDAGDALAMPGVVAVETAATLGLGPFHHTGVLDPSVSRHPLAAGVVRYVGEAVAVVLAATHDGAVDAAEQVIVDIDALDPVPTPSLAAPPIYPGTDTNVVTTLADDDDGRDRHGHGDDPLAAADQVIELEIANPRVASATIENDGIIVEPGDGTHLDIWCTSQGVHGIRDELAAHLGLDATRLRVRSPMVGGGFGGRATAPPEFAVVTALAQRHARPVRWLQTRTENLTGMPHGRGVTSRVRLGVRADGSLVGLDVDATADAGATGHVGTLLSASMRRQMPGLYRMSSLRWRSRGVLTTTTPVGAYRGAGQPEANHARERIIDVAARRLGLDPIDFRRRNLLAADEFPVEQPGGVDYDDADPIAALDRAVATAGVERWRAEQARRGDSPQRIGVGVACYAQTTGRLLPADSASVRIDHDGLVEVACGSPSHGQSHAATWAGIVSDRLGVDLDAVTVTDADTGSIATGVTTGGSAASQVVASVIAGVCDDVLDEGRRLAARMLEAAEADIDVVTRSEEQPAGLAVRGVPSRRITWGELSRHLATDDVNGCLQAARTESVAGAAHPYGAHVTVVEVDTETGGVTLLAHTAVDDVGIVLNAPVVAGQQHGGSVAGVGQALFEHVGFDDQALPQHSTLLTYLLPSAADLPMLGVEAMSTPTARNPLGTRGVGENGCNGATPSAHNAVLDALAPLGIEHIDLPLTPERIWAAIRSV